MTNGSVSNNQTATASSVTSTTEGSDAVVKSSTTTGVDADTMTLGGAATVTGMAQVGQVAGADLTTGDADAIGLIRGDVTGVNNDTTTEASGSLSVEADAVVSIDSDASNTSGGSETSATSSQNSDVIGLDRRPPAPSVLAECTRWMQMPVW